LLGVLKQHERPLYITLLVNFAIMGAVVTVFGAAIPKVIGTYHWSYTDAGTVIAASSAGFFLSSFIVGFMIERFGVKVVLAGGLTAQVVSLMFFARTPVVLANVFLNFLIGIGLGTNELVTNYTVVRIEERGKSRLMNLIHSAWCIGAIVGPLGVANLIREQVSWQVVFPTIGVLVAGMSALLMLQRFPDLAERHGESRPPVRGRGAAAALAAGGVQEAADREKGTVRGGEPPVANARNAAVPVGAGGIVLLCAASIFVYIGVEKGVYSWVSEFFVSVLGTAVSLGATAVAVYWIGQFLGRLVLSIFYRGTRLELVLLVLCIATVGALALLVLMHIVWLALACTLLAGMANSGIFPVIMSLTGKYSAKGRSVGFVTAAGGVSGMFFPFVVARVSDAAGIQVGFSTVLLVGIILLLLVGVVVGRVRIVDARAREGVRAGGSAG